MNLYWKHSGSEVVRGVRRSSRTKQDVASSGIFLFVTVSARSDGSGTAEAERFFFFLNVI